ncbi:hypothetical protein [Lentibacillus sp. Marseille-P4043]|uniref:hypothetical protein n=1 Tax=Lentibacillus sp. Marseille-P4043 TaxID=2040293 RepID=UPI00131A5D75|nr:hypothetical protein [Lentibacillus sp. Marseille-P4043]
MDYILFVLFILIGLLLGTTKQEKRWIGWGGALLVVVFKIVSEIIKFQSGFF